MNSLDDMKRKLDEIASTIGVDSLDFKNLSRTYNDLLRRIQPPGYKNGSSSNQPSEGNPFLNKKPKK